MKIIEPGFEFLRPADGVELLKALERAGRVCYKSEGKITDTSYQGFLRGIIRSGHESVIEHASVSVKLVCDRGVTHELVRHRIASYSQESTRYCNYSQDRFGRELTFIRPCFWDEDSEPFRLWKAAMQDTETAYLRLLDLGAQPQEARSVLPNSLKTEIAVTMNLREWRHFFRLRAAKDAHPQMRQCALMLLRAFHAEIPVVFDDIAAEFELD